VEQIVREFFVSVSNENLKNIVISCFKFSRTRGCRFVMLSVLRLNRSAVKLPRSSITATNSLCSKRGNQSIYKICNLYKRNVQSFSFVQAFDQGLPNSTFVDKTSESIGLFGMKGNNYQQPY